MRIGRAGVDFFHADGWTDGETDVKKDALRNVVKDALRNVVKEPKTQSPD
jgi:hypothetical protein